MMNQNPTASRSLRSLFSMKAIALLSLCALVLVISGCGASSNHASSSTDSTDSTSSTDSTGATDATQSQASSSYTTTDNADGSTTYEQDFGTYTVPAGWVLSEEHSTDDKLFFVKAGDEDNQLPDNIAVNVGTNKYTKKENVQFRTAIVQQLTTQIGSDDAQLSGSGTYTDAGEYLYKFEILEADGSKTVEWYVVGDNRYCLIQLTNWDADSSADDAARSMAVGFVWKD